MTSPTRSSRLVLDATVDVETPEQVLVSYTLAGIGTRGAAAVIDILILILALGALSLGVVQLMDAIRSRGDWIVTAGIIGNFLLVWGYFVVFETIWDGQTPGKRLLGLRVVRNGGGGIDAGGSAARNLIRFVDFIPFGYFVGMASMLANKRNQRLGDLVAGTIVVRERLLEQTARRSQSVTPVGAEAVPVLAAALNDAQFALLDRFVAREAGLDDGARLRLAVALSARLSQPSSADPTAALVALHAAELRARRHAGPAPSSVGTQREEWALIADGRPRWDAFAATLKSARQRGLSALSEDEVTAFVEQYRDVATDLARLRTADRGRGSDAVFSLSRLVSAGHNLLYRSPAQGIERIGRFIAYDVPREVRRSWRHVALASALLYLPAIGSAVAIVQNPALAERMLGPGMIERAEEGQKRGNTGADYLPDGDDEAGSVLSAFLMTNNIKVALMAFAGGATAGLLTVFSLVFNGVAAIGAGVGLYITRGIGGQIFGFIAAHGVLELTAICLAGAAGFLIATGILMPGDRTRREALVDYGRRALHLVACVVLFLILAGLIEGNISPTRLPDSAKYATALITAIGIVWYLSRGRDEEFVFQDEMVTTRRAP
jgi:uncharacterized membrane protein SpoIIM required for sporulation/uncharacterized RDD family membrane protein YckC